MKGLASGGLKGFAGTPLICGVILGPPNDLFTHLSTAQMMVQCVCGAGALCRVRQSRD